MNDQIVTQAQQNNGALVYHTYNVSGNVASQAPARCLQAALRHAMGRGGNQLPDPVSSRLVERVANIRRVLHRVEFRFVGQGANYQLVFTRQTEYTVSWMADTKARCWQNGKIVVIPIANTSRRARAEDDEEIDHLEAMRRMVLNDMRSDGTA